MANAIRILVVGLGNMGKSHALAYHNSREFEIVGLCSRTINDMEDLPAELLHYPRFANYAECLAELMPEAVCISTWPDTHAVFAKMAFTSGAHVFLEKPLAESVPEAEEVVAAAQIANKKLVVGYILRHHPSWEKFVELAQDLGKPLVMRMNLNQQSSGATWSVHKHLLASLSPLVDCGVHYLDIMCRMTSAKPVSVHGIGVRLSEEIADEMYNYGQLQVKFDDGSIGWYEAGWGPMMSETAFFVKDVVGPKGSVSIVEKSDGKRAKSDDMDGHTQTSALLCHSSKVDENGEFLQEDIIIDMNDEPDHNELCAREQSYFADAIRENIDLSDHWYDAVNSLKIALAADRSIREGGLVELDL